jgi:MobA/MobL family
MAIFYFNAQAISRSSGKNACRAAAYNARTKIVDEKTQKSYDYSDRTDLAHSLILTPQIADRTFEIDRATLWNLVEAGEKRPDAQLARSLVLALPTEIDHQAKWLLTQKFVLDNFTSQGMIADVNIHDINSHNPHLHILLTMRDISEVTPSGEIVFGLKNRTWNDKKLLELQKASWANSVNQYLELAQVPDRIDHRTPTERVPQIHIGTAAWEMEKRGIQTERGDLHRKIAEDNRTISLHRNEIAIATQRSIEIELQLEVERREREWVQREESQRTAKREQRRQPSPPHKFFEKVDRANELLQDAIEPPQRSAQPQSQPDPIVPAAQPTWKEISTKEEQEEHRQMLARHDRQFIADYLPFPPQEQKPPEQEEREREARLEVRRLANRADNERVRLARAEAARQRELAAAQQQLESPPAIAEVETPIESVRATYMPTRLELVNWYRASEGDDRHQIEALGQQLKTAYMLQDFMKGQPEPKTLPDEFQSTTVTISLTDKQQFEQKLQTWQQQKRETPLGQFIEDAKKLAAQDPTGQQTFETMKARRTLEEIAKEDPINRAGLKILNSRLISNLVNRTADTENLNKLIVKLEHIRDNPEHYQNLERQQEIERQNNNLRTNTRDRGGRGR